MKIIEKIKRFFTRQTIADVEIKIKKRPDDCGDCDEKDTCKLYSGEVDYDIYPVGMSVPISKTGRVPKGWVVMHGQRYRNLRSSYNNNILPNDPNRMMRVWDKEEEDTFKLTKKGKKAANQSKKRKNNKESGRK